MIEMGDPFQPFIYGQYLFPMSIALKYGIKLVFGGENAEVEYGGCDNNEEGFVRQERDFEEYDEIGFPNIQLIIGLKKGY